MLLVSLSASSAPIELADGPRGTIGDYVWVMAEEEKTLELGDAVEAFAAGRFVASEHAYLNFGIGAKPRWIRFDVSNDRPSAVLRMLSVETSWLDRIDVFFLQGGETQESYRVGDARVYAERPIASRFFVFEHAFKPGITTVYMRVETPDPMVLPIYLTSREELVKRENEEAYSYGIVYGVIVSLLLYNLMLYFGLKRSRYLFYSIYLFLFVVMNISYTGHGYQWLWPNSPTWQLWSNPVLMITYAISGLLFATRFLDTKSTFPRLHRFTIAGCWGIAAALAIAVLLGSHVIALLLAFSFVLLYTCQMVVLGSVSFFAGNQSAKYFLYASIAAAIGATITALAVWGVISYTPTTYRAVESGTMIEAILLALALADLFRRNQEEKFRAEQMARNDPLTGVNNRRAFYELVDPLWQTGLRKHHDMSVMILDIDGFKSINDTFGHRQGDKVLVHTARELAHFARVGDVLARWGGEEFILFMPETKLEDAVIVAQRMREKIAAIRYTVDDKTVSFTASFGVAHYTSEIDSLDGLIARADTYLYRAKERGRNRVSSALTD